MIKQKSSVINFTEVSKNVGDFIAVMVSEYVAAELESVLSIGEYGKFPHDTLSWLYDTYDFSDEISDPQSLDDMYQSTADSLSVAVFEIHATHDFQHTKDFLLQNIALLEDVEFDNRENRIVVNMDIHEE